MSKNFRGANYDRVILDDIPLFSDIYLSLSTEEPTKTDPSELLGGNYARIKWEGSEELHTWPSVTYIGIPPYRKARWWEFKQRRLEKKLGRALRDWDGRVIIHPYVEPGTMIISNMPPLETL